MRLALFALFATVAVTAANASAVQHADRVLDTTETTTKPESMSFASVNQKASFNGINAGEEVLAAVNDALGDAKKIDGDALLSLSKRISADDETLKTADDYTKKVVAAIKTALSKLFPGEDEKSVLRRVLPSIPDPKLRRLEETLESINFKDIGQSASFNGVKAGEQILAAVNKITSGVDGDELLAVARKVVANDKSLDTADKETKDTVDALKQVTAKLFPGEDFATVVNRLMPAISAAQ